jgi:hypothetical protein
MNRTSSSLRVRKAGDVDRQQLLRRLDEAWVAFKDSYGGLSQSDILEPGVMKAWSVRDIIAHVTTWEEEAVKHLPAILEGRRPPRYSVTYGGINAFNALMTAKKAGLSLPDVYHQQEDVHRQVIDAVMRAPDDQLVRETRFRRRLRLDTYGHYPRHAEAIRRWRAQREEAAQHATTQGVDGTARTFQRREPRCAKERVTQMVDTSAITGWGCGGLRRPY